MGNEMAFNPAVQDQENRVAASNYPPITPTNPPAKIVGVLTILLIIAAATAGVFGYQSFRSKPTIQPLTTPIAESDLSPPPPSSETEVPNLSEWQSVSVEIPGSSTEFIIPATSVALDVPSNWTVTKDVNLEKKCFKIELTEKITSSRLLIEQVCDSWSAENLPVPTTATLIDDFYNYGAENEFVFASLYRVDSPSSSYYGEAMRYLTDRVRYQHLTAKPTFEKVLIIPIAYGVDIGDHHAPMLIANATLSYPTTNNELIKLISDKIVNSMRITSAIYPS